MPTAQEVRPYCCVQFSHDNQMWFQPRVEYEFDDRPLQRMAASFYEKLHKLTPLRMLRESQIQGFFEEYYIVIALLYWKHTCLNPDGRTAVDIGKLNEFKSDISLLMDVYLVDKSQVHSTIWNTVSKKKLLNSLIGWPRDLPRYVSCEEDLDVTFTTLPDDFQNSSIYSAVGFRDGQADRKVINQSAVKEYINLGSTTAQQLAKRESALSGVSEVETTNVTWNEPKNSSSRNALAMTAVSPAVGRLLPLRLESRTKYWDSNISTGSPPDRSLRLSLNRLNLNSGGQNEISRNVLDVRQNLIRGVAGLDSRRDDKENVNNRFPNSAPPAPRRSITKTSMMTTTTTTNRLHEVNFNQEKKEFKFGDSFETKAGLVGYSMKNINKQAKVPWPLRRNPLYDIVQKRVHRTTMTEILPKVGRRPTPYVGS